MSHFVTHANTYTHVHTDTHRKMQPAIDLYAKEATDLRCRVSSSSSSSSNRRSIAPDSSFGSQHLPFQLVLRGAEDTVAEHTPQANQLALACFQIKSHKVLLRFRLQIFQNNARQKP
jgi:hypothetical protein